MTCLDCVQVHLTASLCLVIIRELKHGNISSRRRSIFREEIGLRMVFWARIFYLSSAGITTTDACRVKGAKTNFKELSRKQTLNCKIV